MLFEFECLFHFLPVLLVVESSLTKLCRLYDFFAEVLQVFNAQRSNTSLNAKQQHSDQMSDRWSDRPRDERICSGALNSYVPRPLVRHSAATFLLMLKSAIIGQVPAGWSVVGKSKILCGFKSLCIIPQECRQFRPSKHCWTIDCHGPKILRSGSSWDQFRS